MNRKRKATRKGKVVSATPPAQQRQVRVEVVPRLLRWGITVDGVLVGVHRKQARADRIARFLKNAIADNARAEVFFKDRQGRIRSGPQGRDSGGADPPSMG